MPGTLDRETMEAVGVLAKAVDQARIPGVLEFRMLAGALRKALDSHREEDLIVAAAIFEALDSGFRSQIVERAWSEAESFVKAHAHPDTPLPAAAGDGDLLRPKPRSDDTARPIQTPRVPPKARPRSATSFLAALNGGSRPKSSVPPKEAEPILTARPPGGSPQNSSHAGDSGLDPESAAEDSRTAAKARLQAEVNAARIHRPGQVPRAASIRRQGKDE